MFILLYISSIWHRDGFNQRGDHFTYKINKFFRKVFLWNSYHTPDEKLLNSEYMDRYSFVGGNLGAIASYIDAYIYLLFGAFSTLASTIGIFAIYEPLLIIYIVPVTVLIITLYIQTINNMHLTDYKPMKKENLRITVIFRPGTQVQKSCVFTDTKVLFSTNGKHLRTN